MARFELLAPTEAEIADAVEGIEEILWLDAAQDVDLCPCLTRLLLQLEELLSSQTGNVR
jgi:hypothetical protein